MPGRRSPQKSPETAQGTHLLGAFRGALDGASAVPSPVYSSNTGSTPAKGCPQIYFHQDKFTVTGGVQSLSLTFIPLLNSEHVYHFPGGRVSGTYQEEKVTWEREVGKRDVRVLNGMNTRPGDVVVVEYAYYEQAIASAFRELELPHSFVGDDDGAVMLDLPFSFHDHGSGYPVSIASNGVVIINNPTTGVGYRPVRVYESGYCLAPYWMDHDSRPGDAGTDAGATRYGVVTVDGQTALVVIWDNMTAYPSDLVADIDTRRSRFQLVLFSNGVVEFNYDHIQTDYGLASRHGGMLFCRPDERDSSAAGANGMPVYGMYSALRFSTAFVTPLVGYYLQGHMWTLPASNKRLMSQDDSGNYLYEFDTVFEAPNPPQGMSGLTDTGPDALVRQTNCGIPGRLRFDLGSPGPGIPSVTTQYNPVSVVWNGTTTTIIWDGLPRSIGMVADVTGTTGANVSSSPNLQLFYQFNGVVDGDAMPFPFIANYSQEATYASSLPVSAGAPITSSVFMISPYGQTNGHMKLVVNINLISPVLRVHDTFEYLTL